ncbi:TraX family protein [Apilactobacillus ozensis]|uniref:TraX family protein n=1 Tax=Apilactobacillus ozensis TaxID=866801 RepID=UPI00200B594F|nr:TraX family protein [Apilactobacillus ozensis]MCK8606993.1 conjugal transfer protein TraX [Apilactobacillus ozensis]
MNKIKCLTNFDLKIICIILMVGDHLYDAFVEQGAPTILTILGRIVAPVFIFLTVEGYHYTRSKFKYMLNLLLFFWITKITIILITNALPNDNLVLINSMMGTLFLGVLSMWAWDSMFLYKTKKSQFFLGIIAWAFIILAPIFTVFLMSLFSSNILLLNLILFVPTVNSVEGGFLFVLLALLMHIFKFNRYIQCSLILALALLCFFTGNVIQSFMFLSAILVFMYNGKKGKGMKWFFYVFYPVHIAIIYILATIINK